MELLGGIIGGIYVLIVTILIPKLGIGNATVLILLGNVLSSLVIDRFGLFGATVHPVNIYRLLGIVLIIGGVVLVKKF